MKKVLIISYFFPPLGGGGVFRTLKFAKYLPCFGWMPLVLTVKNPDYHIIDPDLLKEIPKEVRVIRTNSFEPTKIFKFLRSFYDRIKSHFRASSIVVEKSDLEITPRLSTAAKLDSFIFVPDNKIGWLPFALFNLIGQVRKNRIDLIYSSSPPFTVHLIGFFAKLILKKPWVVDMRDLWVLNPYSKPPTRFHQRISRYLEYKILKSADKVITVSDPLCARLKEAYPSVNPEKFRVITNGYDNEDFLSRITDKDNKFSIGHVGSLYAGQTPLHFLKALGSLKKEIAKLEKKMAVTFLGGIDRNNRKILEEVVQNFQLEDVVIRKEAVSHREAIDHMLRFDVLLLIIGKENKGCLTGKLFEYLATQKPILALAEDGPARKLIQESQRGVAVDPEDIGRIKEAILNYYERYRKGNLKIQSKIEVASRFERKRLTQQLADILDELKT